MPFPFDRCDPHWWYWVLPSVLKCKRCGRLKYADR